MRTRLRPTCTFIETPWPMRSRTSWLASFAGWLLLTSLCTSVDAQTVLNPTQVAFTVSPDHNVTSVLDNQPLVSSYSLVTMAAVPQSGSGPLTGGAVAFTKDLGKPAATNGATLVVLIPEFLTMAVNTKYVATVSAIGPGGAGVSALSAPFGRLGPPAAPTAVVVSKVP